MVCSLSLSRSLARPYLSRPTRIICINNISLNGRRAMEDGDGDVYDLGSALPPSLLQSGIASPSPERERERERRRGSFLLNATAIPKLWPLYSDKSGGSAAPPSQTGRKEGRMEDGTRKQEGSDIKNRSESNRPLPSLPPSLPVPAPPTSVRENGSHHPLCLQCTQHGTAAFPLRPRRVRPFLPSPSPVSPNPPYQSRRARKSVLIFIHPQRIVGIKKEGSAQPVAVGLLFHSSIATRYIRHFFVSQVGMSSCDIL